MEKMPSSLSSWFPRSIAILVMMLGVGTVCAQTSETTNPSDLVSKGFKFLENVVGSVLKPAAAEFKALVAEGKYEHALVLYERNSKDFGADSDLNPSVAKLLDFERQRKGKLVSEQLAEFADATNRATFLTEPIAYFSARQKLVATSDEYIMSPLIRDHFSSDPLLQRLGAQQQDADIRIASRMTDFIASFPHEKRPVGDFIKGMKVDPDQVERAVPRLVERLRSLDDHAASQFLKNTKSYWQNKPPIRSEIARALEPRLNSKGDAIGRLAAAARLTDFGLEAGDLPDLPRIQVVEMSKRPGEPSVTYSNSHDGQLSGPAKARDALLSAQDSVVIVYVGDLKQTRSIVDKQERESSYLSGQRTVPNPQYESARLECHRAQAEASAQKLRNAVNPGTGWAAAIQGFSQGYAQGNAERVCQQFAASSPTRSEDVFAPYSYTVTEVQLAKRASGHVVVFDRTSGSVDLYPFAVDSKRSLKVAYGRKDSDQSSPGGLMSDKDLEAAAVAPVVIDPRGLVGGVDSTSRRTVDRAAAVSLIEDAERKLAAVSDAMPQLGIGGQSVSVATVGGKVVGPASGSTPSATDPRMQSVVMVLNPRGSLGAGFYIDRNFIVTNFHVVEGSSTVELRPYEGSLFTGRVVRRDIQLDLALIQVDQPGVPLKFSDGLLKAGDVVEAIGHPKGLSFTLTRGIVSAIRRSSLTAGGERALLVQTDTAINPGNSGGPLLLGDRVVGINTIKLRTSEGIGFAVHYSEVIRFLSER